MPVKRALVVDDDEGTVALFRKILSADQWEVEAFTSGHDALSKISPGRFQLVLSDIHMPELGGVEFFDRATKADPELKKRFVFISGYADSSAVKRFLLETRCPGIRKPIRLDEFRAVVAHVGESKPLAAAALPSPWFTPDCVYLYSGEITGRHTLFCLLNRVYSARLTGVLVAQPGRVEKKLYFNLGNLIFAASNLPGDGLGELMLREGALTQAQFDQATQRMTRGQRFGDALVDVGACSPHSLREWIRTQVTQIAASVFDYPAGRYYFFDDFGEDFVPEVGISLSMGRFVKAALEQASDLPLDDLAHDEALWVEASPDPLLLLQDVELSPAEGRLFAAVTGPVSASQLLRETGLAGTEGAHALYSLLALGMLLAVSPSAQPAPARAAEPAPAPPAAEADPAQFEADMKALLERVDNGTCYQLIGVTANSSANEIKKSYYRLVRRFHPDRHMGRGEWIGGLQRIMDALSSAYKTLSDDAARAKYDKQLAESGAFAIGRGKTEKQATAEDCLERAKECLRGKNFAGSITWLRKCVEIAPHEAKYRAMLARSLAAVPTYRQEAVQHYEKAIEMEPFNTSVFFQLGELFEQMKLPWRAVPLYKKILDIDPDHAKARERLDAIEPNAARKQGSPTLLGRMFTRKN
jgi:CheY-like chemotaxis protein/tetratricopeptide (TPR) repeat protein